MSNNTVDTLQGNTSARRTRPEPAGGVEFFGLDDHAVRQLRIAKIDHAGNPVRPFVDHDDRWPLRCCLATSRPGERVAIVAFSPFPWNSPYRATGPVVIHADPCAGSAAFDGALPAQFGDQAKILRGYGTDDDREHTIVYDLGRLVGPAHGRPNIVGEIADMLTDPRVEFVHAYNVLAGCYAFGARRR